MRTTGLLVLLLAAQFLLTADSPDGPERPVARTLAIKVPGKVESVEWYVRKSTCAVAFTFQWVRDVGTPLPPMPVTQVWLLKADGTSIPVTEKPNFGGVFTLNGSKAKCASYSFPASAATEAVAVMVQVEQEFFVESLTPKP